MAKQKKPGKKKIVPPRKKKVSIFKVGFSNLNFIQDKIKELRSAGNYQSAETQRQTDGSGTMAAGSADQQAAIRLMIGTWESIANMVLPLDPIGQESIFGSTPVGYMWDGLYAGIWIIRQNENEPGYASRFEQLDTAYMAWISTKSAGYQSDAAQGLNANFG
jgi:hypothetical protein